MLRCDSIKGEMQFVKMDSFVFSQAMDECISQTSRAVNLKTAAAQRKIIILNSGAGLLDNAGCYPVYAD